VSLKNLDGKNKDETLNNAINSLLSGEVADATRSTLRKQVEQPLPDVKPASEMTDNEMDASNMGGKGQGKGLNRQVRLLPASGDPEVFKVVSLVLGSPDFQRQ
jgi:hypothetical protein